MEKNPDQFSFSTLEIDQAYQVSNLWRKLNTLHQSHSIHFRDQFSNFSFAERIANLKMKEKVKIFCVAKQDIIFGYCIASIHDKTGELDSLYIEDEMRASGTGSALVNMVLQWFNNERVEKSTVAVVYGNEEALPFYRKHGFRERLIILEKAKTDEAEAHLCHSRDNV